MPLPNIQGPLQDDYIARPFSKGVNVERLAQGPFVWALIQVIIVQSVIALFLRMFRTAPVDTAPTLRKVVQLRTSPVGLILYGMPFVTAFANVAEQIITFFDKDVGIVIQLNLTITDFDPTGATVKLEVDHGIGELAMTFDPLTRIATYSVPQGKFPAGLYKAQGKVLLAGGGGTVYTEIFSMDVKRAIS